MTEWEYIVTCAYVMDVMEDSEKWGYWLDTVATKSKSTSLYDTQSSKMRYGFGFMPLRLGTFADVCACIYPSYREWVYIKSVVNSNRNNALCEQ